LRRRRDDDLPALGRFEHAADKTHVDNRNIASGHDADVVGRRPQPAQDSGERALALVFVFDLATGHKFETLASGNAEKDLFKKTFGLLQDLLDQGLVIDEKPGFVLFHSSACPAGKHDQGDGAGLASRCRAHASMIIEKAGNGKIRDPPHRPSLKQDGENDPLNLVLTSRGGPKDNESAADQA